MAPARVVYRANTLAVYLEVGTRVPIDETYYPDDDLVVRPDANGRQQFMRRDGTVICSAD